MECAEGTDGNRKQGIGGLVQVGQLQIYTRCLSGCVHDLYYLADATHFAPR